MFKCPEQYRVRKGGLKTTAEIGNNGVFSILGSEKLMIDGKPVTTKLVVICVASDQRFWETVTVTVTNEATGPREPTQQELRAVRNLFWGTEDFVFTYYPNKNFKEDNAPIVQLLSKPGWKMPDIDFEVLGLEKKNLIQRING